MAKPPLVAGLILIAFGGAAVAFGLTREISGGMSPESKHEIDEAASKLDQQLGQLGASTSARALSLADFKTVRDIATTDMATIQDMVAHHDDLGFKTQAGETTVLARTVTNQPAGQSPVETLIVLPAGAQPPPLHGGAAGTFASVAGTNLTVTAIAPIRFTDTTPPWIQAGFIAVARTLDLAPTLAALQAIHVDAELMVDAARLTIGAGVGPDDTATVRTVAAIPGLELRYIEPPPVAPAIARPAIAAGAGGALFGLVLVLIGVFRRTPDAAGGGASISAGATIARDRGDASNAVATGGFAGRGLDTKYTAPQSAAGNAAGATAAAGAVGMNGTAPGQMFGRWEVVRRLGSGGMADVYLARARGEGGFEKLVALKVMHAHLARNERAVEHFLDEAKLAATVQHPNVVAIQDLGRIGDDFAIVMEFVDGVDLERLLMAARTGSRPVPVAVGLAILCRICDGLSAAHKATSSDGAPLGIIHRDVKSANVLVSRQGVVKVVDFGIAKAATQSHLTIAGETKGTPSMMAPEQRVGEMVDVRADVYSVAAVGFEILTNHGVNLDLAALAHLGVENWPHLPLPSSLRRELPTELDAVLLGAMAFERDKRPASCDAFGEQFEAIMKKHGLNATDKDIARWVEGELAYVEPVRASAPQVAGKTTG